MNLQHSLLFMLLPLLGRGGTGAASAPSRTGGPDVTPPQLRHPEWIRTSSDIIGPGGAWIFFDVEALDDRDPDPVLTVVPPSGSYFPPGWSVVKCTALDAARNRTSSSFPVLVTSYPGPGG